MLFHRRPFFSYHELDLSVDSARAVETRQVINHQLVTGFSSLSDFTNPYYGGLLIWIAVKWHIGVRGMQRLNKMRHSNGGVKWISFGWLYIAFPWGLSSCFLFVKGAIYFPLINPSMVWAICFVLLELTSGKQLSRKWTRITRVTSQ